MFFLVNDFFADISKQDKECWSQYLSQFNTIPGGTHSFLRAE